ncbi:DUF7692 domain-containing protein [Natrinema salinisoli]|uniref:DUF7692 domain-containing protein n=1 Tax=Natrinema salinisoli TaxID=2878535 RepID=UPI003CCE48F4
MSTSIRIQTDGEYAYRDNATDRAVGFYDCNKTKVIVSACDEVPKLVAAVHKVLGRDYLTHKQKREREREIVNRRGNWSPIASTVTVSCLSRADFLPSAPLVMHPLQFITMCLEPTFEIIATPDLRLLPRH